MIMYLFQSFNGGVCLQCLWVRVPLAQGLLRLACGLRKARRVNAVVSWLR
jgi:hypothetical protein